ncbi:MAG: TetR/AcrR family transcriptional regulator [Bacteroidetes bacterium]|nr:TetR/AcrR family transcriptional regulator [Bacteroidota bacterium]
MAKEKRDNQTEKLVLEAAMKVFTQKGYAAARMDDIAKEANINRALLHYYFRSKDKMFDLIFEQKVKEFFSGLGQIVFSDRKLEDVIREMVKHEITLIVANPYLPLFVLQELQQSPERLLNHAKASGMSPNLILKRFSVLVNDAIRSKTINKIEPGQLLINIMSLCIYPMIAKPVLKSVLELDDKKFDNMMAHRIGQVSEFILLSIKPTSK